MKANTKYGIAWALAIGACAGSLAAGAPSSKAGPASQQEGAAIYHAVCQSCHMADAKGAVGAGAYPSLARNSKLKVALYPIQVVVGGQRAMPALGSLLDDAQIADVINYLRTHFGNAYRDALTPKDIAAVRSAGTPP